MKPENLPNGINNKSKYILAIDPARQGMDESAFVILEQLPFDDNIFVIYVEALHTPDLRQVIGKTIYLDKFFKFTKIYIDETGLGAGISDILKDRIKGKVEGIWYTAKKKAEIFQHLRLLMSRPNGKLYFPDYRTNKNPVLKKMYFQFLSILSEHDEQTGTRTPKIFHEKGKHDDIINALAMACLYFKVGSSKKKTYPLSGFNFMK